MNQNQLQTAEQHLQTPEDVELGQAWYTVDSKSPTGPMEFGVNLSPDAAEEIAFFSNRFAAWDTLLRQHYGHLDTGSLNLFKATLRPPQPEGDEPVVISTRAFQRDLSFLSEAYNNARQEWNASQTEQQRPRVGGRRITLVAGLVVAALVAGVGIERSLNDPPRQANNPTATPPTSPYTDPRTIEPTPTSPGYTTAPSHSPSFEPSPEPSKAPSTKPNPTKHPNPSDGPTKQPEKPPKAAPNPQNTISFATLNVMGASHSDRPGGKNYGKYPKSPIRNKLTRKFILKHHPDVLGLQELQRPQRTGIYRGNIKRRWGILPKKANYRFHASENSMLWKKDKLKLLDHGSIKIPYFKGSALLPWAVFKIRKTGKVFATMNVHNPANTRRFPKQADNRAEATGIEKRQLTTYVVRGIAATVLGDWNAACETRKNDEHSKSELAPHVLSENDMFEEVSAAYRGKATCYNNSKAIDLVFASKPGKLTEVEGVDKIPTGRMSDHGFAKISDINVSGSINASQY